MSVHALFRYSMVGVKPTVLPPSRISHTATGLLKIRTTETKPNPNPNTNSNPNPNPTYPTNPTKPQVLTVYGAADPGRAGVTLSVLHNVYDSCELPEPVARRSRRCLASPSSLAPRPLSALEATDLTLPASSDG